MALLISRLLLIIVLISILLMLGIKESASVNDVIVVVKLAVVVMTFIAVGVHYIKPSNYTPFIPPNTGNFGEFGFSGIMRAAGIIFFAYIGFDTVSTAAQEAHHPQRDIPRGHYRFFDHLHGAVYFVFFCADRHVEL